MNQKIAYFVSAYPEESLTYKIFISHLKLFTQLKFEIHLIGETPVIPANLQSNVVKYAPVKKPTSFLSKLLKKDEGQTISEFVQQSQFQFTVSFDSRQIQDWSERHFLILDSTDHNPADLSASIQKALKVLSPSLSFKKSLPESATVESRKLDVLYPFFNRELFSAKDRTSVKANARKKMNLKSTDFIVGYHTHEKSVGPEQEIAKQVAAALSPHSQIQFIFFDPQSENNLTTYFQSLDLFIKPIVQSKFGIAVLEAMACGLPVLTSQKAGASELILSKQFVREFTDAQAWADHIVELEKQKDWLNSIGRQNGERAILFDENHHLKKWLQILASENCMSTE